MDIARVSLYVIWIFNNAFTKVNIAKNIKELYSENNRNLYVII